MNETHKVVAKTMIKKSGRSHTNRRLSEQLASCNSQPSTREAEEVQYRCADVLGSLCLETSRTVLQACHKDNSHIKSPPESFSKSLLRISWLTSAVAESGQQHALAYQTPRSIFLSLLSSRTKKIRCRQVQRQLQVVTARPLPRSNPQKHSLARLKAPAFLPNRHHSNAADFAQEAISAERCFQSNLASPPILVGDNDALLWPFSRLLPAFRV
jgi:hypothetical protein